MTKVTKDRERDNTEEYTSSLPTQSQPRALPAPNRPKTDDPLRPYTVLGIAQPG